MVIVFVLALVAGARAWLMVSAAAIAPGSPRLLLLLLLQLALLLGCGRVEISGGMAYLIPREQNKKTRE